MKEEILNNLDNPLHLEKLYRDQKLLFKKEFNSIYESVKDDKTAQFWNARLNYETEETTTWSRNDIIFVIILSLIAGLIAKLPQILNVKPEFFFPRNIGFVVFPFLAIYFAQKNKISNRKIYIASFAFLVSVIYINILPGDNKSDTFNLACIHLPLFLWTILGYSYVGENFLNFKKRIEFLKYIGDLVVMTTLIVIAGGILTGLTIGLFSLIDLHIEKFYMEYIVTCGLAASPIVGTYLTQTNPQLVGRVSPVIAKIFSPLVLVTLVIYLIAIVVSGKDPYNDREFLVLFNSLLIGVMALILFSIAESSKQEKNMQTSIVLFLLSAVTIVINTIALSAILFRISEWGITPNRLAVLGSNILILANLIQVTYSIFKSFKQQEKIESVEKSIAFFLPVYASWTVIVIFLFPIIFSFK